MILKWLAGLLVVGTLMGCAGAGTISEQDDLYHHYVRMDRDGSPRNVLSGKKHDGIEEFKKLQLSSIKTKISEHVDQFKDKARIVVYLHGAPLFGDVQIDETKTKLKDMKTGKGESNDRWYPLLVNWEGSLGDVYEDHLFRVRQGRKANPFYGYLTYPFVFIGDFLVAIGRAPSTWATFSKHTFVTEYPNLDNNERGEANRRQESALDTLESKALQSGERKEAADAELHQIASGTSDQTAVGVGEEKADGGEEATCPAVRLSNVYPHDPEYSADTLAKFPVDAIRLTPNVVLAPLAASYGSAMWKNYHRRAQAAIRQTREFESSGTPVFGSDDSPSGTLAVLMKEIANIEGIHKSGAKVILIGHSTGALILTELISTYASDGDSSDSNGVSEAAPVPIEKIVFLGAAATFDDFNKAIVPYLKGNSGTHFYNISLNAYNEAKSSFLGVRTPSLLEWLDMFIARPAGHLDRVMGKWENVMLAMHTIPCKVRGQVHLKHLPGSKGYPRHHRDLDNVWPKFNVFNEGDWEVGTQP